MPYARRLRAYQAIIAAMFLAAILFITLKGSFNFVVSDGRGYYAYLPSLVIDADLDFSNQISEHWDVDFDPQLLRHTTLTGLVANKYPIGMALSLAPGFVLAHILSHMLDPLFSGWFVPNGYSLLYQLFALFSVLGFGFALFVLIDRILVALLRFSDDATISSVVLFSIATHFSYYLFREPLMVHVVSTFWVSAGCYFIVKLAQLPSSRPLGKDLLRLGFCVSMAVVSRPTNAVIILPFMAIFLIPLFVRKPQTLLLIAGAGTPALLVQMLCWKILYGSFLLFSYEGEGFNWAHPALWSTLFSSKHGLFFWTPLLLLAFFGILRSCFHSETSQLRRQFSLASLLAFVLLWYCNASWHQWWFGDAFGARAFLELAAVFCFGLAETYTYAKTQGRRAILFFAGFSLVSALYMYALMALYILHRIPRADYLF